MNASQLFELFEEQTHRCASLLVRIELNFAVSYFYVSQRHAEKQLAAARLVESSVQQAIPHYVQLHFAHDSFEAQQKPIIGIIAIVHAVFIGDERAEDGAHLKERMPVLRRTSEPAHL